MISVAGVTLAEDVILLIIDFLDVISLIRLSMISKAFRRLITIDDAQSIWTRLLLRISAEECLESRSFDSGAPLRSDELMKTCTRPYRIERGIQIGETSSFAHSEVNLIFSTRGSDNKNADDIESNEDSSNPMLLPGGRWIIGVAGGKPRQWELEADLFCWDSTKVDPHASSVDVAPCAWTAFSKSVNRDFPVRMWSQGSLSEPSTVTIIVCYVEARVTSWIYEAFQLKWEGDSDQPTFLTRNVLEKKPPVLMESVQLDGDLVCMRKSGRSSLVWNWKTGARAQIALAPSLRSTLGDTSVASSFWLQGSSLVVFSVDNDGEEDLVITVHHLPKANDLETSETSISVPYTRYPNFGSDQSRFHWLNHAQPVPNWVPTDPTASTPDSLYCIRSHPLHEALRQDAIIKLSPAGVPTLMGFCRSGTDMSYTYASNSRLIGLRQFVLTLPDSQSVFIDASLFDLESCVTHRARTRTTLEANDWSDVFSEGMSRRTRVLSPFCVRSGRILIAQNGVRFALLIYKD